MRKKIIMILSVCAMSLTLYGCNDDADEGSANQSSTETSVLTKGDYAALLPFEASSSRTKHAKTTTDLSDSFTIGTGLMELSKEHFSSSTYAYREGQFLTFSVLDATEDQYGLLGRTSSQNPIGMNPKVGVEFQSDAGKKKITANDVVLIDIHELDWYQSKELAGVSLAIVLNDEIGDAQNPDLITDQMLRSYGEDIGRKVVSYMRKTHPEIGQKVPIYVTLYRESGVNSSLPGTFFEDAYFESKTVGEFASINESWALFPGSNATSLDGTNATYFTRFVNAVKSFFPEDTSVIGRGHFKEGKLDSLLIDVTMHAKTWPEANAMIQQIKSELSIFSSNSFGIKVRVRSGNELIAAMARDKGSNSVTAISLED